uniref:Phosphodiesterase 12 n=1 Tax=Anolis carolinensis TaxID=28377 RepID=A0A803TA94_ANOCA
AGLMWRRLCGARRALLGLRRCGGRPAPLPPPPRAMERAVVVRCVPSEPKLSVSFVLGDGSARHMQRDQAEPLGRALARIATNGARDAGDGEGRRGAAREAESGAPVEAGPGACSFDARHLYTRRPAGPASLRAVSYNVLADAYAQSELSRTVLYPYCAPYALEMDYRQSLLQKELLGYNADLLCLQEVDRAAFADGMGPALDAAGLEGLFRLKERQHEGLATFFRRDKLRLLTRHDLFFQVSVLQTINDPSRQICVANTHLYWHPKGNFFANFCEALSHLRHVTHDLYPGTPLLFCGDFNKEPHCSMSLTHPFRLKSACGEPAYTNYVGGFHGCLDYIFIDADALEVEQVIPLPSHEEVTTHQALPSVSHPSDHIALVCDLKWKKSGL